MTPPTPTPSSVALLIVDDSDLIRTGLRRLLSAVRQVTIAGEAANVPEAIRRFEELKPDVVILDIQMPGGSGLDVLKWIKSRVPSCLVMMVSSCPREVYGPLCREHGADHYFDKTSEIEKLVEALTATLAGTNCPGPPPGLRDPTEIAIDTRPTAQ